MSDLCQNLQATIQKLHCTKNSLLYVNKQMTKIRYNIILVYKAVIFITTHICSMYLTNKSQITSIIVIHNCTIHFCDQNIII